MKMTDTQSTKQRLYTLLSALQLIQDNYGINASATSDFNTQKNELLDIINTFEEAPAVPPVTVDDVIAAISTKFTGVQTALEELVALANSAGEPAAA